jgi:hypothetical protein
MGSVAGKVAVTGTVGSTFCSDDNARQHIAGVHIDLQDRLDVTGELCRLQACRHSSPAGLYSLQGLYQYLMKI